MNADMEDQTTESASYAQRTADLPQQPDGIEEDSHDLPDAANAAKRVHEFLCEYGDGIVDAWNGKALYARDLEALTKLPALVEQLQGQLDAILAVRPLPTRPNATRITLAGAKGHALALADIRRALGRTPEQIRADLEGGAL